MLFLLILGWEVAFCLYRWGVRNLYFEARFCGSWTYAWQYLIGSLATNTLLTLLAAETIYCFGWSLIGGKERVFPVDSIGYLALYVFWGNLFDLPNTLERWHHIRTAITARHRAEP